MIKMRDRIVVVTRKTALEELVERFNTRDQARFYIEHMGGHFEEYQDAHDQYQLAVEHLRAAMPRRVPAHWIDRSFLPTYEFEGTTVVVVLGQDGLVVNTAKYLGDQLVVALNPDPARIDGVLLPFTYPDAARAIERGMAARRGTWREVTMARAELNDGQSLLAVNDLFVGQKTHASARYRLAFDGREEDQSSSGIIVSTGAGSTGWHRSILAGAAGIMEAHVRDARAQELREGYRFDWESPYVVFHVREPFISKTSGAGIVHGRIERDRPLEVISHMPQNGVIFSDGVEEDRLDFNSGAIARIGLADRTLRLVVPEEPAS